MDKVTAGVTFNVLTNKGIVSQSKVNEKAILNGHGLLGLRNGNNAACASGGTCN